MLSEKNHLSPGISRLGESQHFQGVNCRCMQVGDENITAMLVDPPPGIVRIDEVDRFDVLTKCLIDQPGYGSNDCRIVVDYHELKLVLKRPVHRRIAFLRSSSIAER